jgi:hypothetical protein
MIVHDHNQTGQACYGTDTKTRLNSSNSHIANNESIIKNDKAQYSHYIVKRENGTPS